MYIQVTYVHQQLDTVWTVMGESHVNHTKQSMSSVVYTFNQRRHDRSCKTTTCKEVI